MRGRTPPAGEPQGRVQGDGPGESGRDTRPVVLPFPERLDADGGAVNAWAPNVSRSGT
jgi:hypothetical protein